MEIGLVVFAKPAYEQTNTQDQKHYLQACGTLRPSGREQSQEMYKRPSSLMFHRLRPYHPEHARSRPISEAKQGRAWLVLGWETAWEYQVL